MNSKSWECIQTRINYELSPSHKPVSQPSHDMNHVSSDVTQLLLIVICGFLHYLMTTMSRLCSAIVYSWRVVVEVVVVLVEVEAVVLPDGSDKWKEN